MSSVAALDGGGSDGLATHPHAGQHQRQEAHRLTIKAVLAAVAATALLSAWATVLCLLSLPLWLGVYALVEGVVWPLLYWKKCKQLAAQPMHDPDAEHAEDPVVVFNRVRDGKPAGAHAHMTLLPRPHATCTGHHNFLCLAHPRVTTRPAAWRC